MELHSSVQGSGFKGSGLNAHEAHEKTRKTNIRFSFLSFDVRCWMFDVRRSVLAKFLSRLNRPFFGRRRCLYETRLGSRCSLIGCAARYVSRLSVACHGVAISHYRGTGSLPAATHPRNPKRAAQPQPIGVVSAMIRLAAFFGQRRRLYETTLRTGSKDSRIQGSKGARVQGLI